MAIRLNNARINLRPANQKGSAQNRRVRRDSASGFKGVALDKRCRMLRWRVRIKVDGKDRIIGYFDNPVKAAVAYFLAAEKYHGKFSRKV